MKILILDDLRSRRNEIAEKLVGKGTTVTACLSSNEFIAGIENNPTCIAIDMESWYRGHAIYNRFNVSALLEKFPVVFYNTHQNFSMLGDRPRNENDRIVFNPAETDAVAAAIKEVA